MVFNFAPNPINPTMTMTITAYSIFSHINPLMIRDWDAWAMYVKGLLLLLVVPNQVTSLSIIHPASFSLLLSNPA